MIAGCQQAQEKYLFGEYMTSAAAQAAALAQAKLRMYVLKFMTSINIWRCNFTTMRLRKYWR
jgi:hypothetical protein